MNNDANKARHWFRGIISLVILGPFFVVCSLNLIVLLVLNFLSGLNPLSWFSSNVSDWIFSYGNTGGAANYLGIVLNGLIAFFCASGISWAFTGSGIEP